jgi:uncharacterized oxidoreductase
MHNISDTGLQSYVVAVFEAAGASSSEAGVVAEHLVAANLAGVDSHGVLRVAQYVKAMQGGQVRVGARLQIVSESESMAVVDGGNGFGQIVCGEAMDLAIKKAQAHGVAAVSVRNSYHSGWLAGYSRKAASQELIGLVMVNAGGGGQSVAPFGGLARRLATNPVTIAAPSRNGFPLVLDMATSVAPEGKIRDCYQNGKAVPAGWLADSQGKPTVDAKDFYESGGALLPLGGPAGYKGFGLGFMIDILAGALSGAGCCRPNAPEPKDGLLMIALDIKRFVPMAAYYEQVSALVAHMKSCPPAPGCREVYVPGEIEFKKEQMRRREGIELSQATWQALQDVGASLGLKPLETAESAGQWKSEIREAIAKPGI